MSDNVELESIVSDEYDRLSLGAGVSSQLREEARRMIRTLAIYSNFVSNTCLELQQRVAVNERGAGVGLTGFHCLQPKWGNDFTF